MYIENIVYSMNFLQYLWYLKILRYTLKNIIKKNIILIFISMFDSDKKQSNWRQTTICNDRLLFIDYIIYRLFIL